MDLLNVTNMKAGYSLGIRPDGRELLVAVVKGTFAIPIADGKAALAPEQQELLDADVFAGEPGFSPPLYEMDFAPQKPRCDVLLNGSAYAPGGRPVERVHVSVRVGGWRKSFDVVGHRTWQGGGLLATASQPEPFTRLAISYGNAFGGVDRSHDDARQQHWYAANHVGVGYHENTSAQLIQGKPLPNTEESGRPVQRPNGDYCPMAFGSVGRAWQPRAKLAGTYDQQWIDNVFPFLPADFREEYYQAAPADQQVPYLQGGEEVELTNLTPQGKTVFRLPSVDVPVIFYWKDGRADTESGRLDTVLIEPDLGRFSLCWRAHVVLPNDVFDVRQVLVGRQSRAWHRARRLGKTYYVSLRAMADRRAAADEDD